MNLVAGIDPGICGAICLYDPATERIEEIFDMPTIEITRNGSKRRQIDLYALARWMDEHAKDIKKAFIENPQGMPGMAANATYQLGHSVGVIKMAVAANLIPMDLISPQAWKKTMALTKDKDSCRLRASQLSPKHADLWARKKDDGRAEAFLLTQYGLRDAKCI